MYDASVQVGADDARHDESIQLQYRVRESANFALSRFGQSRIRG